ncbi:hypothetical protein QTG54_003218 [Skeletonema marinoi]|uniref:Uncharacterized protein n=1 Tax=Skeletonema marinoi TaxID=267567 RepID=A0AAD8YK60_9STRA|nr:hypothetical protein QTG54_003218 [Skeletonema marinoi]
MVHRLSLFLAALMATQTQCFTATKSTPITATYRHKSLTTRLHAEATNGVQLISLESLGGDHEAVGDNMGKAMAAWLDVEWMPQEIHVQMGIRVKNTYVQCRTDGKDDVAEIMTQVTDDLYENWAEYNADAFVNAWDCGNYVADYLIAKSGSETCGCSTKIED